MSDLTDRLDSIKAEGRSALIGYLPVGYPTVDRSIRAMVAMVEAGVDIVEVGLPYSDPVMDGPVIQKAAETALDDLAALQKLAVSGTETTFASDIVTALDLQRVVITNFSANETAGNPKIINFMLELVESPPLPPPAQLSGFGGLDDFGLGDLGFDTDILDDLNDLAGDVAGAIDAALDAVDALDALAGLAKFDFDGLLDPVNEVSSSIVDIGGRLGDAMEDLGGLFSS